ncbi:MAG: hypothetical protein KJ698_08660 [Actinobacteria bacterium]|nr:hypothetical protein [Actinomycetota bacterium]MBU1865803.1 hypothetical protein [Actinomycetota bacterium]
MPVRDQRRINLGMAGVGAGLVLLTLGVLIAHFTGLSPTNQVGQEIYPHIPRCLPFETSGSCWMIPTIGQLIGLLGSQILLGAIVFGWILGKPLTWAAATVAAAIFTLEMLILFGVVPNQWLALTQGTFEWTGQKIAFTIPSWLVLGNEVSISYGVIKDVVAGGYSAGLLGAVAVTAYKLQERAKKPAAAATPAPRLSSFGRTIVKGER